MHQSFDSGGRLRQFFLKDCGMALNNQRGYSARNDMLWPKASKDAGLQDLAGFYLRWPCAERGRRERRFSRINPYGLT
jgi:hypothetical protein